MPATLLYLHTFALDHVPLVFCVFFFFNDTATTEIYTLSLHDALPISRVPVVVIREPACEYRSSFLPITKRRRLAVCLPICLPISSRRSSLSTAIRLTERPISPER